MHRMLLEMKWEKANAIIQVKKVFTADFPDNTFDTVSLLSIVKKVEEIKRLVQPEVIFTHHIGDMNIDHQLTHKAVLTATRPMAEECVKEIFSFEVPSSTEWNSFSKDTAFVPNVFFLMYLKHCNIKFRLWRSMNQSCVITRIQGLLSI